MEKDDIVKLRDECLAEGATREQLAERYAIGKWDESQYWKRIKELDLEVESLEQSRDHWKGNAEHFEAVAASLKIDLEQAKVGKTFRGSETRMALEFQARVYQEVIDRLLIALSK